MRRGEWVSRAVLERFARHPTGTDSITQAGRLADELVSRGVLQRDDAVEGCRCRSHYERTGEHADGCPFGGRGA